MKKIQLSVIMGIITGILFSCQALEEKIRPKQAEEKNYPVNFDFATVKNTSIQLTTLGADDKPVIFPNIRVYDKNPDEGGVLLYHGASDENGKMTTSFPISLSIGSVYIQYNEPGVSDIVLPITDHTITHRVKAKSVKGGRISAGGESISEDYYPYINTTEGVLMYEDNWPYVGDFDLNDLVVKYKFTTHTVHPEPVNTISSLTCNFDVKAIGATFNNSFHLELENIGSAQVESAALVVNGVTIYSGENPTGVRYALKTGNGKTVQTTIFDIFSTAQLSTDFVNTLNKTVSCAGLPKAVLTIQFTSEIPVHNIGISGNEFPYNPFIRVNGQKDREVHLVRQTASGEAIPFAAIASSHDKNSNYRADKNNANDTGMPFAMLVPVNYDLKLDQFDFKARYALEQKPIYTAFPKFDEWALSSGGETPLWYQNYVDAETIVPCSN